eukprot:1370162-Amphidinium_carterae.1
MVNKVVDSGVYESKQVELQQWLACRNIPSADADVSTSCAHASVHFHHRPFSGRAFSPPVSRRSFPPRTFYPPFVAP